MYKRKALFLAAALAAAMLQGCGGGSDSTQPAPPAKMGDFELIAGTLTATAPDDAPRYQNGPALGVDLAQGYDVGAMVMGANGHIYLLKRMTSMTLVSGQAQDPSYQCAAQLDLIEIDPSTGLMQVQQIPYNPWPVTLTNLPCNPVDPSPDQVVDPAGFTVASDGSALIGDNMMYYATGASGGSSHFGQAGYGAGIWRFKDGMLSKFAGFDLPFDYSQPNAAGGQDGQGGAATFMLLGQSCAGPDGAIYVTDYAALRRVLPDGTVQTIAGDDPYSIWIAPLLCATNQRAITAVQGGQSAFRELSSGQTFGGGYLTQFVFIDSAYGEVMTTLDYGFGDVLAINEWTDPRNGDRMFSTFNLKTGATAAPWIRSPYIPPYPPTPTPAFQLTAMPYVIPSPRIVIDNNDMAYISSGNALLRYPLKKLQANQ